MRCWQDGNWKASTWKGDYLAIDDGTGLVFSISKEGMEEKQHRIEVLVKEVALDGWPKGLATEIEVIERGEVLRAWKLEGGRKGWGEVLLAIGKVLWRGREVLYRCYKYKLGAGEVKREGLFWNGMGYLVFTDRDGGCRSVTVRASLNIQYWTRSCNRLLLTG
jgi:hypothetical protein